MDAVKYTRNLEEVYLRMWSETIARATAAAHSDAEGSR
jgi:hypothetical protein